MSTSGKVGQHLHWPNARKCCLTRHPSLSERCVFDEHGVQQAGAHYFALCMHGLRTAGRVSPPLRLATGRNNSCGQVTTLPRARAWCAGNQCCCRHGGRRDGICRRCGGSTRRAPSATGLYRLILIKLLYNLGYPGISRVIPKHELLVSRDILGYVGISRLGVYPMITRGNTGQPDITHPKPAVRFSPLEKRTADIGQDMWGCLELYCF